ncbi:galactosyl transferase [Devosia geojensis]|uniref:Galactosyl transferase n=1 Tax=Devosia geojensis TaxID=443610 RepID=A0A0F5FY16_9HYPH|nr:hypothetical protein [Devosia geojensis]KKB13470.1 galactosyl transferase [Devosia geojensis]
MNGGLTFVIPVRHQDNAPDWNLVTHRLKQTIQSISAQDAPNWRGIVVANEGASLPAMPPNWDVVRVTFPPNPIHERRGADKNTFYDAFRLDKGRRVLSGMLSARDSAYFMIVDDDDFVSRRLARHVRDNNGQAGWHIMDGYIWEDGTKLLLRHDEFANLCGTSLIIRSDIYNLPERFEDAGEEYIKSMFGSHLILPEKLKEAGAPLPRLPFPGAVYRIGHVGAHSQSVGLIALIFSKDRTAGNLLRIASRLWRIRFFTRTLREEFFGGATVPRPIQDHRGIGPQLGGEAL